MLSTLLLSGSTHATQIFLDGLYWQASETNNWAYTNSNTTPVQNISYKTLNFNYQPGFRIGGIYSAPTWDSLFSYTQVHTNTKDSTSGNVLSAFLGTTTAKPFEGYFFDTGRIRQTIDYDMLDLNFGKQFQPASALMLHPFIGVMGGWINQNFNATYQGAMSTNEIINNNFTGIGPKFGIDTSILFLTYRNAQFNLLGAFAASYLIGHWVVTDDTMANPRATVIIANRSHNMGAPTMQAMLGAKATYKKFAVKLAYEFNEWFNQVQFYDNDSGTHGNDLVMQGFSLGLTYEIA